LFKIFGAQLKIGRYHGGTCMEKVIVSFTPRLFQNLEQLGSRIIENTGNYI
jgi:hypothetical protein